MTTYETMTIPQIDGGVRIIAITSSEAALVRDDPAMLDGIGPDASMDVWPDGTREWVVRPRRGAAMDAIAQALEEEVDRG